VNQKEHLEKFVDSLFTECRGFDRNFVKWKLRLDKVFPMLSIEDLGSGPVVDLGCGYGIALALAGYRTPDRELIGCDLDAHRIATARRALAPLKAEVATADARSFEIHQAGLILIIDVLQYMDAEDQLALLQRCCSSLRPGGTLIFRVPDGTGGKWSSLFSLAFDRLIFLLHRTELRPTVLSLVEYRLALQGAGMQFRERPFVNRFPLAHVLFTAVKPSSPRSDL